MALAPYNEAAGDPERSAAVRIACKTGRAGQRVGLIEEALAWV
jgi:hypothetical protein